LRRGKRGGGGETGWEGRDRQTSPSSISDESALTVEGVKATSRGIAKQFPGIGEKVRKLKEREKDGGWLYKLEKLASMRRKEMVGHERTQEGLGEFKTKRRKK